LSSPRVPFGHPGLKLVAQRALEKMWVIESHKGGAFSL
jgi:hypothetical protein